MISAKQLQAFRKAKPFAPFRVVTADGRAFAVNRPDFAFVTTTTFAVGEPDATEPDVPDRVHYLAIEQIVRVEALV